MNAAKLRLCDARAERSKMPSGNPAGRPVVPAVPSESGVGEEDPGDFENASIRPDDGERSRMPQPKPEGRHQGD